MTNPKDGIRREEFEIGVHVGNVLWYLAHLAETPSDVIAALVQNSLDKKAKHIIIVIDEKRSMMLGWDDGLGATKAELLKIWNNVGMTNKFNPEDIGEKGLDKIAALFLVSETKGEMTWITRSLTVPHSPYIQLHVLKAGIKKVQGPNDKPKGVFETMPPGFGYKNPPGNFQPTTCVILKDVMPNAMKQLARIEEIASYLGERYAVKIKSQNALVRLVYKPLTGPEQVVDAKPQEFPGRRQRAVSIPTPFGDVDFQMFTTVQPVSSPKIMVDHKHKDGFDLYRVRDLWRDVKPTLGSGFFQGYIYLNFCTLRQNRKGFDPDEQFEAFVTAVQTYAAEYCPGYIDMVRDRGRSIKHAEIIRSAVEGLDALFQANDDLQLQGRFKGFVSGSHVSATAGNIQSGKVRITPPTIEEARSRSNCRGSGKQPPTHERLGKTHSSAEHPNGYQRHEIKSQFGITVKTATADDARGYNWRTRFESGIVFFNVEHGDWQKAEERGDKHLRLYVQRHLCKEIAMQFTDSDTERKAFDRLFQHYWMRLIGAFD
ncbi:MAG: ATP-binding protein [Patescibacteria group bacterium]|jgi:hypothetical protein